MDGKGLGGLFAGLSLLTIVVLIVWWLGCGVAAAVIANGKGRSSVGYFLLGLVFLGPLAIAVAILVPPDKSDVAPSRPPVPAGRRRFICPRCGAEQNIPDEDTSYDCWQCSEHRRVKPKKLTTEGKPSK